MMKKRIAVLIAALLVCACILPLAAAEDTTITATTNPLYVTVGKAANVKVTIDPREARKAGVTYAISDESIATVTSRGRVTGVAVGDCELTITSAHDPSATLVMPVHVVVPVKKLTVTMDKDELHIGEKANLLVAYEPSDATAQQVIFETSNENVAVVSETGEVNAVSRGQANIIVRSVDGNAKAKFRVRVDQKAEAIDLSEEAIAMPIGKKIQLKATVLPKDAHNKGVSWQSADATIATVDAKGRVTIMGKGETTITAVSDDDPAITTSIPVQGIELVQSLSFDAKHYDVIIGQTAQLFVNVQPEEASIKSVTYKVKNAKIASVDENGVVTGLKGGKTTIYAYSTDGSKKRAQTELTVIVPVTGVAYKTPGLRVGAGSKGSFTAEIEPKDATNKNMTWTSDNENIASVNGSTNRFSVKGRQWGRCKITGTTEDGNYTVSIDVNVGSLRHAVAVLDVQIRDGKPYLSLKNKSDMHISQVRYQMRGYDGSLQPVQMSTQTGNTLKGTYDVGLSQGEKTHHGRFSFFHPTKYPSMLVLDFAITGWTTDTGYYNNEGKLCYDYEIPQSKWEWVRYSDPNVLLAPDK